MKPDENQNPVSADPNSNNSETQTPEPVANTTITPSTNPTPPSKSHKKLIVILVVVLVLVLAGGGAFALYHHNHKAKPVASLSTTKTSSTKTSQSTTTTSNAVVTKYINLPATSTNFPNAANAQTAYGNYIAELDNQGGLAGGPPVNQELIYNGKTLYSGTNLTSDAVMGWTISENGLHYAYILSKGSSDDLYIDGKVATTISSPNMYQGNLTVSNNGQDYAYVASVGSNQENDEVIKDGNVLYNAGTVIDNAAFSSDLSKYIIAVRTVTNAANSYDKVIYDGTTLTSSLVSGGPGSVTISENGEHTFYTDLTSQTDVDGNSVSNTQYIPFVDGSAVTDNGGYGLVDFVSHYLDINGKISSISPTLATGCNPGCGGNPNLFAMNQTATHYIVGDVSSKSWYLDGTQINLTGKIEQVELDNNTLYVYVWSS